MVVIKYVFSFLFLLFSGCVAAQDIIGSWQGSIDVEGKQLHLVFHISNRGDVYFTKMDSPQQGATGIPTDSTGYSQNELTIKLSGLSIIYNGKYNNDTISGTFTQNGMKFPLSLSRLVLKRPQEPKPPFNYNIHEVVIENKKDSVFLAGTLTTPLNKKNYSVVILITGSGATTRDHEFEGHKPFWVIADDFAKKGIGVLRLDDRGMGKSTGGRDLSKATSKNFAGDISAAVDFLASKGYRNIGLVGHSEGGMIAPMTALQNNKVKYIVLIASPGIDIIDMMRLQSKEVSKSNGSTEIQAEKIAEMNAVINRTLLLADGQEKLKDIYDREVKKIPSEITLTEDEKNSLFQSVSIFNNHHWYKYFISVKPDEYLSKIKIPVLAINGSLDTQVPSNVNLYGIESSLKKAGNKNYTIKELPGLNHMLQHAKTGSPAEYKFIEETIAPEALDIMSEWILRQK